MSKGKDMFSAFRERKTLFIVMIVALFLLELQIFAFAAMKSGRKSRLQVLDSKGNLIHETDGNHLSEFNRYYFEKTFGPFEQYDVRLVSREAPFPFRAWFFAATGIPLGAILMFAFVVRAFDTLFGGHAASREEKETADLPPENRFEAWIARVSRLNIFIIGFLVFAAVFLYWTVPNLLSQALRTGEAFFNRYMWLFVSFFTVVLGAGLWIIYLRYLLARKTIESRAEIEKLRLQLEFRMPAEFPLQIGCDSGDNRDEVSGVRCRVSGGRRILGVVDQEPETRTSNIELMTNDLER